MIIHPKMTMSVPRIVGFEGIDASGKTSLIRYFQQLLDHAGIAYLQIREPGGTQIGEAVRNVLLNPEHNNINYKAEALLYTASRAQLAAEVIGPALQQNKWVLCDRTVYSTLAFQGYARRTDIGEIRRLQEWALGKLWPDQIVLLDCSVETSLRRLRKRGTTLDRIEQEQKSFHERARAGYLEMAKAEPSRFLVLDAEKSCEQVAKDLHDQFWLPLRCAMENIRWQTVQEEVMTKDCVNL